MPNELIPQSGNTNLSTEVFKKLTSSTQFLERIQLFTSSTNPAKEGKIPVNHYGVFRDGEIIDLGKEVDAILIEYRFKALASQDDPLLISYDPQSDVFRSIMSRSEIKNSGCMYGPEFLIYIPSIQTFATFFMGSPTARREARKMEPLLRCGVTLKSKPIKQGTFVWTGPVSIECSTPLDTPEPEELEKKLHMFRNPPVQEVELAGDDDSGRER